MFTSDSRTETYLTQMGVQFAYSNSVKFAHLKPGWDTHNLARPVPKREDAIMEYAALMESGSPAPATILHRTPDGFDVLDGVQRLAAAELNSYSQLSAYIVDSDSDDMVAAIRVLANARLQGRAEPGEWTRRRAVEVLVVGRGMTFGEVAKMGGWRPADIERIADAILWRERIHSVGGPTLPDNMLSMLSQYTTEQQLEKTPKPIASFLHDLKKTQLACSDAEPYVDEFFAPITKQSNAHKIYTARLESFRAEPEVHTRLMGRKRSELSSDVHLLRTLKSAVTVLNGIAEDGEQLPYVDEFYRLLREIETKIKAVAPRRPEAKTANTPADRWK